ncbi:hypothetical protein MJM45_27615, partial [Salmonella enterica subsp. enterica serovar Kentucky]|nr:hypothetical protein [Salmonella enterica subsp. enterica serovar Kentucky]
MIKSAVETLVATGIFHTVDLHGLTKRFAGMDKPAVAPLDCTIHSGYVTGLVGPDGAGKTTL